MNHRLAATVIAALLAASASAQNDDADLNTKQAQKLNAFAKKARKQGFPRQAKVIWLQVLKLYDPENAEAHKELGHVKVGSSWNPDPSVNYPTDDTGTSADGQSLYRQYEALTRELASAHRAQAEKWQKADRTDQAQRHWRMVLRWQNDDKQAQTALEHREVGGMTGTALEQTLYERTKLVEKAVAEQTKTDYPVQKVEDRKVAELDKAQVKYLTLTSEHFTVHGDVEEEKNLGEALRWAERALQVVRVAFPWKFEAKTWPREWAFFVAKDTYKQILKANVEKGPDLDWRLEHSTASGVGKLYVGATGNAQALFDAAVRQVAQVYANFGGDGLREGIGHTFVGMMFNNNRLFAVDLKKQQGTVASEEDREYTSPDFDVWKTLNLELAWKSTGGVPARELPFCEAAKFTNEQRIKAWSFCDYVMRRDPTLLRDMDQLGLALKGDHGIGAANKPHELEKRFDAAHDVKLAQLEREWEDFWTEASSVLKAIQNNTPPLAAISKGVEKWLEDFNAARKAVGCAPVNWSTNLSARCHDHAVYLKENKGERGPAKEHTQSVDLGGTHVGAMFAEMAVVETEAKAGTGKKLFQHWLDIPGYRDALVNDHLRSVGIYSEGDILVMNVTSALGKPRTKTEGNVIYPRKGAQGIPCEVPVAELGPEVEALLEKHGQTGKKVLGYPMSLHFGQDVQGNRQTFACKLTSRDKTFAGALLMDGGRIRRTSAPGMVTFYPFEPLPHGEFDVVWTWQDDAGPQRLSATFKTK